MLDPSTIKATFNHVALPPQLPGSFDKDMPAIEEDIMTRILKATDTFIDLTCSEFDDQWQRVRQSLESCKHIHKEGLVDKISLIDAFQGISRGNAVVLHISEQNAGILIRLDHCSTDDYAIFEAFEASPKAEDVLASPKALLCDYPATAVAIPLSRFREPTFQDSLASFLEQASAESIKLFAAHTRKAGTSVIETRDTVDPSLICSMLMTLLEAMGRADSPPLLQKRVRDDVCWKDAEMPWRRSAFWLVLRVSIQRLLSFHSDSVNGRVHYKFLQCVVHSQLLQDSVGHLPIEMCHFLRSKLCRRLAKLELERESAVKAHYHTYQALFDTVGPFCDNIIRTVTKEMESKWASFKGSIKRRIPSLQFRADNRDLLLTLPNCHSYMNKVLASYRNHKVTEKLPEASPENPLRDPVAKATKERLDNFSDPYFRLSKMEADLEKTMQVIDCKPSSISSLGASISEYLVQALEAYQYNIEERSQMVLIIFEVWVAMDKSAIHNFPLLKQYHPGFRPEILDVLHLFQLKDMRRLQKVQKYLQLRCKDCRYPNLTIFSDPVNDGLAVQYFDRYSEAAVLRETIQQDSRTALKEKTREMSSINEQYNDLTIRISTLFCCCQRTNKGRITHSCPQCVLRRQRKKLKINVHEAFLPSSHPAENLVQQKAVLFELVIPAPLSDYREVTWRLISTLGVPPQESNVTDDPPKVLLSEYDQLRRYRQRAATSFELASTTKSFLVAHYKGLKPPLSPSDVLLPFGLKLSYYDKKEQRWARDVRFPVSLAHHFTLDKSVLNLLNIRDREEFAANATGPSSYSVVVSQTRCPPELTVHEFTAYQGLLIGRHSRWLSMLREMGSSNLNFSLEETMHIFNYLSLQVGPMLEGSQQWVTHIALQDIPFCDKLSSQITRLLEGISSSWRESYCMELLVTIILRVCSLGSQQSIEKSLRLLIRARELTHRWIQILREEIHNAEDSDVATNMTRYALMSALLCKRTFAVNIERQSPLDSAALRNFVEASITVQDNLPPDPSTLPESIRTMFIRDIKMTFASKDILRQSVKSYRGGLEAAVNSIWPEPAGYTRRYSPWRFLKPPFEWWIVSEIPASNLTSGQIVHYHLLEGHFLLNNKPIGKLPREIQESPIIEELFGNQPLLTYPSALSGMTYTLARPRNGHEIHIGMRNGELVLRARIKNTLLEYVERNVFGIGSECDFPLPLVNDCVHWLDLHTQQLEFRRRPRIWAFNRQGNWVLDVKSRNAYRRRSRLVDPHSHLFGQVASIFKHFEDVEHLAVFQPSMSNLTVELKRMNLEFRVNRQGLLSSRQLRCVISPNQDAGTWYGLQSMLILHNAKNALQRSILVPLGPLKYARHSHHVAFRIVGDGRYAHYSIDDVLGRVSCTPEPLLLFMKASFHAYTSSPLPDPLTRRTGTEEALACLSSASLQPWSALHPHQLYPLLAIAQLPPRRTYYPPHLKCQQKVIWNNNLTMTIQHDGLRAAVEGILVRLEKLAIFSDPELKVPELPTDDVAHLRKRSCLHRCQYQRQGLHSVDISREADNNYARRMNWRNSPENQRVYEVVHLFTAHPTSIRTTPDLRSLLLQAPLIRGYNQEFVKVSLTDTLETDVVLEWGALVNLCRRSGDRDKDRLIFQLGLIAFSPSANMDLLRSAVAFFLIQTLRSRGLPHYSMYTSFGDDDKPTLRGLEELIKSGHAISDSSSQSGHNKVATIQLNSIESNLSDDMKILYDHECREFARALLVQWPSPTPSTRNWVGVLLDAEKAITHIRPEWLRLFQNRIFSQHLSEVQQILNHHWADSNVRRATTCTPRAKRLSRPIGQFVIPSLSPHLIRKQGPSPMSLYEMDMILKLSIQEIVASPNNESTNTRKKDTKSNGASGYSTETQELKQILQPMLSSNSALRKQYADDLMESLAAFEKFQQSNTSSQHIPTIHNLQGKIKDANSNLKSQFKRICQCAAHNDVRYKWLEAGQLWPCLSPVTLLERLRTAHQDTFGKYMKSALYIYAVSITRLQHMLRIQDAFRKHDFPRLHREQRNPGHGNWHPEEYPDWLLLEIDSNILIRDEQVEVARATISPISTSNSVLQMNMGQGKTSVIIPMVACAIANMKSLARVIVPRALLSQTAHILQSRLGGLVGRELCHIPFLRKTPNDGTTIATYRDIHEGLRARGGVILAQPDHVLSFRLSGLQALADGRIESANIMIPVQFWLDQTSRDVIDESDFTLAVKTQLIYPSGSQLAVDGHPYRWKIAEQLLNLVEEHAQDLQREFPYSVDIVSRPSGGFPFIYFLRSDIERALHARLVQDICEGKTSILPTPVEADSEAIRSFLSDDEASEVATRAFDGQASATQALYLLRGLLVHGILILCLKKRWNVQYGLHPGRDPIAVPFHAKGVPSQHAEWGHPDVSILLTCLAFYYHGLTVSQMREGLGRVLHSDDPSTEYERWTQHSVSLPDTLRHWNLINAEDEIQVQEIWEHLRYERVIINDYLNNFVFPAHARQFKHKLQASGWDIPVFTHGETFNMEQTSSESLALTTGFSGTNDNRRMLPLTIRQEDLPGLAHTNAEVLTYLLQPRNRGYVLAATPDGKRLSEREFLIQLKEKGIRLLIDAGAHVLELDNKGLVREWLEIDYEAPAAIYFNADNQALVFYRNGKEVSLLASPFVGNLENCLVYLDEAHTRGTDLKLPVSARGALTLSLGQTKDHTVQAAMRLRQLGTTQSIVFIASPEVHQSILDHRHDPVKSTVDSSDVVSWLLEQTCHMNEQLQPLYLSQGYDFCRRRQAATTHHMYLSNESHRSAFLKALLSPEEQTLKQLYHPRQAREIATPSHGTGELRLFWEDLRKKQLEQISSINHTSAFEEVEQEREIAFQVEEVRQAQRQIHFEPHTFPGIHPSLLHFAKTGEILGTGWYEPIFRALRRTALGKKYGIWINRPCCVLLSSEFTKTTRSNTHLWRNDFLRPVHWILWSPKAEKALVIIPEEAEHLIPILRNTIEPATFLLIYAAPTTRQMLHFNDLTFYTLPIFDGNIPAWLKIEIGLLAGRLYFNYAEYEDVMQYLDPEKRIPSSQSPFSSMKKFASNPTGFLEEWFAVSRKGQDFNHTPMGYICQGRKLRPDHPFFITRGGGHTPSKVLQSTSDIQKDESLSDIGEDSDEEDYGGDDAEPVEVVDWN